MNVKQGDMAIIINSVTGLYIGMVVEVVELAGIHESIGPYWKIRCPRDVYQGNKDAPKKRLIKAGELAQNRDAWLRPVSGLPDDSTADENIKVSA
jgi:hypothetical protein